MARVGPTAPDPQARPLLPDTTVRADALVDFHLLPATGSWFGRLLAATSQPTPTQSSPRPATEGVSRCNPHQPST